MQKIRLFLIAACFALVVTGCSEEEKPKKKKTPQQSNQTQNTPPTTETQETKVAALPLIKAAEANLKKSKGYLFSMIGNQSLSLENAENPMVNQIEFTGKESTEPEYTIHLQGKLNQKTASEIYLTNDTIYEKIKNNEWTKRSTKIPRRNPADSILLMNKLMKTLGQLHKDNGLEAIQIGETYEIKVSKSAFADTSIEKEIQKYKQKAIETEVHAQSPGKKVESVSVDQLKLVITINRATNKYTKISTTIQTSYQVDQTVHIVEEVLEKSWGEPFDVPLPIPSEVKSAK